MGPHMFTGHFYAIFLDNCLSFHLLTDLLNYVLFSALCSLCSIAINPLADVKMAKIFFYKLSLD